MDNTSGHNTVNFASKLSKHLSTIVDAGGHYPAVAPFSYLPNSKGSKRKWKASDGPADLQDCSSLFPGFGCSSSSCITISSGKEIEEDASMNLGLGINLDLKIDRGPEQINIPRGTPKALISEGPKLDLELSLSTNLSESAPLIDGTVQAVDEGSTSSRWKQGPLVPSLQGTETNALFVLVPSHDNPCPAMPRLSSSPATATQKRNSSVKICQFSGCMKGARGTSGFCIGHGGGRRCQRVGCDKGAEGRTVFCKAHGGGRRCQFLGCTKSAEGRTDYCIAHGGGRRCSNDGCSRAARGKSGLCIRHGGGKRCKMENCTRSAEGISGLCISHGGGRRCQFPGCIKGAQGSTMCCKAHGGGKRCTFLGCMKGAEGSTPFCKGHGGGKRCTFEGGCTKSVHGGTLYCVSHGGGKRCAVADCTKSARGRTNFCVRHGGGKRCKYEGCDKSAQGSTDFCKGHGGGKRCSWGPSDFGGRPVGPCDKFARGKSGLCALHSSHATVISAGNMGTSIDSMGHAHKWIPTQISPSDISSVEDVDLPQFSLPEGRVHGGSLMAMLTGSVGVGPCNNERKVSGLLEPGTSFMVPHKWV